MRLVDFLSAPFILDDLEAADKEATLSELVRHAVRMVPGLDPEKLLQKVKEREKQSSTAIGHGVAIPHTHFEGLEKPLCLMARSRDGIAFDAPDKKPVFLFFLLVFPPKSTGLQLKMLARIARLCSYDRFTDRLKTAADVESLWQCLQEEDGRRV